MSDAPPAGVVVDTMVISWLLDDRPNPRVERYRALIGQVFVLLAFHTVMELRFGAIRAAWGELRRRRLERSIAKLTVIRTPLRHVLYAENRGLDIHRSGATPFDPTVPGDAVLRWCQ